MTDLSEYVGASDSDAEFVAECEATATALVAAHIGSADVPAEVMESALLECGSKLFQRRLEPNGAAQFATFDGTSVGPRAPLDPMVTVYPILAPYVGLGFG